MLPDCTGDLPAQPRFGSCARRRRAAEAESGTGEVRAIPSGETGQVK